MRRTLLSAATAALTATVIALSGGATAAQASTTTPPPGCDFYRLVEAGTLVGGYTHCTGGTGLHTAVVQCADGTVVRGFTEEMQWSRYSTATCGDWLFGYRPAVAAWGEFHLD